VDRAAGLNYDPIPMHALPTTIGPYRILATIGKGGMGVVYRAEHRQTGRSAALKTVRVPRATGLQGIRREISALARLRHPGIVRILDHGLEGGLPWYAMELLEAPTLRQVAAGQRSSTPLDATPRATPRTGSGSPPASSRTASFAATEDLDTGSGDSCESGRLEPAPLPEWPGAERLTPLQRLLTLVRRLCTPLAFLHGEGLLHGDLKPDNVFVLPGGHPVLVDFGLTSRFAPAGLGEELELGRALAGTTAYMAPEQIRGGSVDARADLYSLGCILYELVTGRRPFLAGSQKELLERHLEAVPHRPSELAEAVPPLLDELVFRLLAKRPEQRLGYAEDVAAVLARLGAEDSLAADRPPPRPYLYRPGLAGREAARTELEERLRRLRAGAGHGGLLLLGGESGVGKTRLLLEALREQERRGGTVLGGECPPARPALGGLRRPLRSIADRCRERGWRETERILGARGRLLAAYEPELSGLPGQEAYPEPPELPPEAAQQRLYAALTETLAAYAGHRPLLLALDDLHWADELTAGWIESLLRHESSEARRRPPLLVLGAYRVEEAVGEERGPPLRLWLAREGVERMSLSRLDEAAIGAIVRQMLALPHVPPELVQFLTRGSGGNPFFVLEVLRLAVAEGVLRRDGSGAWTLDPASEPGALGQGLTRLVELPMPGSIRSVLGTRLERLGTPAQRLAEAAAVLDGEAASSTLAAVAGAGPEEEMEAIAELLARQILEEAGPLLRLAHDQIREAAYERIPEARRRLLHRRAAELLEGGPEPESIGRHWERAGEPEPARAAYLRAARAALARHALHEAERLYRAHLALATRPDLDSLLARYELAKDVYWVQGRHPEALEQGGKMHQGARELEDRVLEARSLLGMGRSHWATGRTEEARRHWTEALEQARAAGDSAIEMAALGNLASLLEEQGRFAESAELFERALGLARRLADRRFEGICLGNLANLRSDQGRMDEALELYRQDLAIALELGDRRGEGHTLGNLASLYRDLGRLDQAVSTLEQAVSILRELGYRRLEGIFLTDLAVLRMELGHLEPARAMFAEASALLAEVEERRFAGVAFTARAAFERRTGRLEPAQRLLQEGRERLEAVGDRVHLALNLCERGHLALAQGHAARDEMEAARREAEALEVQRDSEVGRAVARLDRAVQALAAGERLFRGERAADLPAGLRDALGAAG
jgi:serine/threonine protein kinase/tetratricopeptide (TPR) repeat protein